MSSSPSHILVFTLSGWGHLRPCIHTMMHLLNLFPDLYITFLADRRAVKRIPEELAAYQDLVKANKDRYRIVSLLKADGPVLSDDQQDEITEEVAATFDEVLERLVKGEASVKGFGQVPKGMIIDLHRVPPFLEKIRLTVSGHGLSTDNFKCVAIVSALTCAWQSFLDDIVQINRLTVSHPGDQAALDNLMTELKDLNGIRDRPDLPTMKNFELIPQVGRDIGNDIEIRKMLMAPVFNCDGVITLGTPEIEPESTKTTPALMEIPLYTVGYTPNGSEEHETSGTSSNGDASELGEEGKVKRFMDESLAGHGPRSVAYVSFGSYSWPSARPEGVNHLITSLLTAQPPLSVLIGMAATDAQLSEETKKLMQDTGRAMTSTWVPQRFVLAHSATSFFVVRHLSITLTKLNQSLYKSHVGVGSVYEAITAKVPLIMVPQWADQPITSALLTRLGAGIPLLQFCTGHEGRTFANGTEFVGTEKAMKEEMGEIWQKVRGAEGDTMRAKLAELDKVIRTSWEQGEVRKSTQALGTLFTG